MPKNVLLITMPPIPTSPRSSTMSNTMHRGLTLMALPAALVLLTLVAYGFDRFGHSDSVARNVTVAGVSVGGQDEASLRRTLHTIEDELNFEAKLFVVNGKELILDSDSVRLTIDEDPVVAQAMAVGRSGNFLSQFGEWLHQVRAKTDISLPVTLDDGALETVLTTWDLSAIGTPGFEGAIVIEDGKPVPRYPSAGVRIDRQAASSLVLDALLSDDRLPVELPLLAVQPTLQRADVNAALAEAELMLTGPIVLSSTRPLVSYTFAEPDLSRLFRAAIAEDGQPRLVLTFDPEAIGSFLAPVRSELELAPVDAGFRLGQDDVVVVTQSSAGTLIEPDAVAAALFAAAHTTSRIGVFPFAEGDAPSFSTEEAEAMFPLGLVSEFTTEHPCCAPRVDNIHRFADYVDGAIVWPGDTLSLNEVVGQRTVARGFVTAPAVERDQVVDVVGGGVSQFITTFYNAVFFGGYEDTEHWPHTWYFSRYPEGREATISWPAPDLRFTNDTEAIVLIDTLYTSSSITVRFFGNNGGRVVTAGLSDRFEFTEPPIWYEPNPEIDPGTENVLNDGRQGWNVTVIRTIAYPDGTEEVERKTHRYRPRPRVLEVHPCDLPEDDEDFADEECPVLVPDLIGMTVADAEALLDVLGLDLSVGDSIDVTIESGLDGLMAGHTMGLVELGGTVTVNLGVAPPPPTTTTTTTTVP